MTHTRNVPSHLAEELARTDQICMDFIHGVIFLALSNARDTTFPETHLLSCIADDYLETALAIPLMAREGIHNACRRELRFLLEMSIKLSFVQQAAEKSSIEEKISMFRSDLDSPSISLRKRVQLPLFPELEGKNFLEHVGQLYGETSNYVHLTTV